MVSDGMTAVLALLTVDGGLTTPLAGRAAAVLGATGLSASVTTTGGGTETAWSADGVSSALQDLQFTLGEGPSVDVARRGDLMLVPDLGVLPALRWAAFAGAAGDIGVRALFAFPLRMGAINLGVLEVYRTEPGPLRAIQLRDALALADTVTASLLRLSQDTESVVLRAAVHQATGMIAVQLGTGLNEALVRLRAYAFGTGLAINQVAADVVAGRLDFTDQR